MQWDFSLSEIYQEFPSWHLNKCWLWIKSLKLRTVPTCSIFINNGKEDAKCPVVARKSSRNLHSHSTPPDFLHFSPYFSHLQLGFLPSTICISSGCHLGFVPIRYLWAQIRQFVIGHSSRGLTVWLLCTNASPPGQAQHHATLLFSFF